MLSTLGDGSAYEVRDNRPRFVAVPGSLTVTVMSLSEELNFLIISPIIFWYFKFGTDFAFCIHIS